MLVFSATLDELSTSLGSVTVPFTVKVCSVNFDGSYPDGAGQCEIYQIRSAGAHPPRAAAQPDESIDSADDRTIY